MTFNDLETLSNDLNVAFSAGSSKHGKAVLAPAGSKCVVARYLREKTNTHFTSAFHEIYNAFENTNRFLQ